MSEEVRPEGEGWGVVGDGASQPPDSAPAERWRRFTPPALLEDSPTDLIVEGDWVSHGVDVTWPPEVIGKIRAGYQCLRCWEPQEQCFPEACPVCGYGMRTCQREDFEHEFAGDKWVGSRVSLDEAVEGLQERSERRVAAKPEPTPRRKQ